MYNNRYNSDIDNLEEVLSKSFYESVLTHTWIDIDILNSIHEELSDDEWETLITLLEKEKYNDFLAYIERRIPDIKHMYEISKNWSRKIYSVTELFRNELVSALQKCDKDEVDLLFSLIETPKSFTLPEINSLVALQKRLRRWWFIRESKELLMALAKKYWESASLKSSFLLENNQLKLVINEHCIYKHQLHTNEQRVLAYYFLASSVPHDSDLLTQCAIPEDLYVASLLVAKQKVVYNVAKEKTYIRDLEEFKRKCKDMWLSQQEIDIYLHDKDIQNYIASGEAYFSVRYSHQKHQLVVSLYDKKQDEVLGVMLLSDNISQVYRLLQYFKQNNQTLFSLEEDNKFSLDASF
jgi:hypothetical protein